MTEREELEARRDTLQKVLAEARAEVAAREASIAQELSALTRRRDELLSQVTAAEAALSEVESEAAQVDDEWKTARREAAGALEHLRDLRGR